MRIISDFQIPSFPGFYHSIYSFDNNWDYIKETLLECFGVSEDNLEGWDLSDDYYKSVCEEYASVYKNHLNDIFGVGTIEFKFSELYSPREYNFSTDRILCDLIINDEDKFFSVIKEKIENDAEFIDYLIHKNHTSCSGFISFMGNRLEDWKKFVFNFNSDDFDLYISYLLYYIMLSEFSANFYDRFGNKLEKSNEERENSALNFVSEGIDCEVWENVSTYEFLYPVTDEAKDEYDAYIEKEKEREFDEKHQLNLVFKED